MRVCMHNVHGTGKACGMRAGKWWQNMLLERSKAAAGARGEEYVMAVQAARNSKKPAQYRVCVTVCPTEPNRKAQNRGCGRYSVVLPPLNPWEGAALSSPPQHTRATVNAVWGRVMGWGWGGWGKGVLKAQR